MSYFSMMPPGVPPSKRADKPKGTMLKPIEMSVEPPKVERSLGVLPSILAKNTIVYSAVHPTTTEPPKEKKKTGRPSKAEKMKEKRLRASEAIRDLVSDDDLTKEDVRKYLERRIAELNDD